MADAEALAREFGYQPDDKNQQAVSPTINKHEALAREFGYDPNYKEPEKPVQNFWQGLQNDPTLLGATKRAGVGILRGAKDVIDTGAEALGKGAVAIGLPVEQSVNEMVAGNKAAREQYTKEYPPSDSVIPSAAEAGRIGGQIATTLPIMPTKAFQAINAGVGALPTIAATGQKVAAPLVNRLVGASGTGALGGAVLGAATSSSNDKSLAENVGEGAITGAIGGPLIEGAAQAGKGLASKIVGKISPTRASLAERAEQLGIPLKATQVSDSPFLKKYDQVSGWFPFSGAQDLSQKTVNAFNRAVSKTFGKDVEDITPGVVKQGLTDIGNNMNTLKRGVTVDAGPQLQQDFLTIIRDAASNLQEGEVKPIFNNLKSIAKMIDPNTNTMTGDIYHNITKHDGLLSKLQNNSNPNIANAANQIRKKLEEALERSMTTQQLSDWRGLKLQYKSGKTVQELIENDPDGKVSALKLMRKVAQSPGGKLGSGELGELADIGREFFKLPNDSGTPLGNFFVDKIAPSIHSPVSAISAGAGAFMTGAPLLSLAEGGAGLAVNRGLREAVNSKTIKDAVIRAGKGSTYGNTNAFAQAIEPYSSKLLENRNSKKETLKLPVALGN